MEPLTDEQIVALMEDRGWFWNGVRFFLGEATLTMHGAREWLFTCGMIEVGI